MSNADMMQRDIKGNEWFKREEAEKKEIENEKREFLEKTLSEAEERFKDYEKGYRAFSVGFPKQKHFSMDDEILTTIIDGITYKYKCELKSFAQTEIIYPKSYTFTFFKK
jgi:hypothetical protein